MKNLVIALNVVLLISVIILFAMFHSLKKDMGQDTNASTPAGKGKVVRFAYVNADSINANYLLMKDFNSDIQQKENAFQDEYNAKAKRLQDEYQIYMQKKQTGNISEIDDQKSQKDLEAKKEELDGMQQQRDEFVKNVQDQNFQIRKKIQNFITDYNKKAGFDFIMEYENVGGVLLYANDSFDITKPIITELNRQYKDSLQKASSGAKH